MSTQVEVANITAFPTCCNHILNDCNYKLPIQPCFRAGGNSVFSGGIVIEGELSYPTVDATVDDARLVHVQFTPTLPWGYDDLEMDCYLFEHLWACSK